LMVDLIYFIVHCLSDFVDRCADVAVFSVSTSLALTDEIWTYTLMWWVLQYCSHSMIYCFCYFLFIFSYFVCFVLWFLLLCFGTFSRLCFELSGRYQSEWLPGNTHLRNKLLYVQIILLTYLRSCLWWLTFRNCTFCVWVMMTFLGSRTDLIALLIWLFLSFFLLLLGTSSFKKCLMPGFHHFVAVLPLPLRRLRNSYSAYVILWNLRNGNGETAERQRNGSVISNRIGDGIWQQCWFF